MLQVSCNIKLSSNYGCKLEMLGISHLLSSSFSTRLSTCTLILHKTVYLIKLSSLPQKWDSVEEDTENEKH